MALPAVPNVAFGRPVQLAILARDLPTGFTSCQLGFLLLLASGMQTEEQFRDAASLAAITGTSTEASFTNYQRQFVAPGDIVVNPSNANNNTPFDIANDPIWANPGSVQGPMGACVFFFKPSSGAADSACVPLFVDAASGSTAVGVDYKYQVNSLGLMIARQG